jgi:hypothetical protein
MNHRFLTLTLAAAGAAGLLAGCTPLGSPGALGDGAFAYACSGAHADTSCTQSIFQITDNDVPALIAVGAHFDVQYGATLFADDSPATNLTPAAPALLATEPSPLDGATGFRFAAPGTVAILANAADGSVINFLHFAGGTFDHVSLKDFAGNEATTVSLPSDIPSLVALPQSAAGQTLAGGMDYAWTTSDPSVVTVSPVTFELGGGSAPSNNVDLVAGQPGTATVTVTVLGKQASVAVTVTSGGTP